MPKLAPLSQWSIKINIADVYHEILAWHCPPFLFNAFLLICLRNFKFLLLIYFFGGVALPPRFLQWSVNFLKSQQMVRERQTRISTENNDISREVKCNKFWFVIALSCLRGGLMLTIINMTRIANTCQEMVRSGSRDKTGMCLRQLCSALKRLKSKGHWLTDKVTYWAVQDISQRLPKQSSSDLVRGADRRLPKRLKIRKTTVPTVKS